MNIDINKLEKEIKDYKTNFFSSWNDEKYKWEAVSWFLNPEKPDVPLNKNDAFQKVQKRRVQEKR